LIAAGSGEIRLPSNWLLCDFAAFDGRAPARHRVRPSFEAVNFDPAAFPQFMQNEFLAVFLFEVRCFMAATG